MARSLLFTNHLGVLTVLAERPDMRLRDIAREVGITERAVHRIINELCEEEYLTRTRKGARNQYALGAQAGRAIAAFTEGLPSRLGDAGGRTAEPGDTRREPPSEPAVTDPAHPVFATVFSAAPAGIAVGDRNGQVLAANPAFLAILKRTEADVLGRHFREFTFPEDNAGDELAFGRLVSGTGSDYVREKRFVASDGTVRWVEVRASGAAHPGTGEPVFVATIVDISDRKRQAQALAEAEERFRSAFDDAPIGMAIVSLDRRWLKVNRALCELTGYSETALLVSSFQSITHPDDLDLDRDLVDDVRSGRRRHFQIEKRYIHAQGDVIWVMASVSLVRNAAGEPLYLVSQIEDITERRSRDRALRKLAATASLASADTARAA